MIISTPLRHVVTDVELVPHRMTIADILIAWPSRALVRTASNTARAGIPTHDLVIDFQPRRNTRE